MASMKALGELRMPIRSWTCWPIRVVPCRVELSMKLTEPLSRSRVPQMESQSASDLPAGTRSPGGKKTGICWLADKVLGGCVRGGDEVDVLGCQSLVSSG